MPKASILVVFGIPREDVPGVEDDWVSLVCEMADGSLRQAYIERADPEAIARSLLASMDLEPIDIGMVPREGPNFVGTVGAPVWMWVDNPSSTTWGPKSILAGGVSMTARATKVVWSMGDDSKVTCQKGTEWAPADGLKKSPDCGHLYKKRGRVDIAATSFWTAHWSGYGRSGDISFQMTKRRSLQVTEIQVVVTGP